MIRAVFDVNLLVSGLLGASRPESVPGELFRRWEHGDVALAVSRHLRATVEDVLDRSYFRERVSDDQRHRLSHLFRHRAAWTEITRAVSGVAPDAEDDLVLATALSAGVPYLVTARRCSTPIGHRCGRDDPDAPRVPHAARCRRLVGAIYQRCAGGAVRCGGTGRTRGD